jgi:hypothetical protein
VFVEKPMRLLANVALALIMLSARCHAEVTLVREYVLKPPRDKRILFAMAVTPGQDVLSFIASDENRWRLSRVRRWLDDQPIEESLAVPGLGRGDGDVWAGLSTTLFLSPDGKLAVCIASGARRAAAYERQEFVSVVDLSQFRVIVTVRPSSLAHLAGSYRSFNLNRNGRLVVNGITSTRSDGIFRSQHKLAILALPGLDVIDGCEYSEWSTGVLGSGSHLESEGACAGLVKNAGVASLQEYLRAFIDNDEVLESGRVRPAECAFLTYASYVSRDGRLRRELCTSGHRSFWGNFVVSNARENVFSAETGKKLGSIKWPSSHPLQARFTVANGQDYLMVMEGGTLLRVYHIVN